MSRPRPRAGLDVKTVRLRVAVQKAVAWAALPSPAQVRRWVTAAAGADKHGELTVRLVGEPESAALNERYRGRAGPTNVLAFPAEADFPAEANLSAGADEGFAGAELAPVGDLVICAPVVEREAREQGKALEAHWAHILMHGTLHLLGYDHEDEEAARRMEDRERELLRGFGFGDPYAAEADGSRGEESAADPAPAS